MQTSSKKAADTVNDSAPADAKNDMPEAKAPGKMVTRSALKSQRSSESAAAADMTVASVMAEDLSDEHVKSNSSVKDFDLKVSPSASKQNSLDSEAKVSSDIPAVYLTETVEEKKQMPVDTEQSKDTKTSEENAPVEGSKKRTLDKITGGLQEETSSKSSKRLKLSKDEIPSKKSVKPEEAEKMLTD